MRITSLRLTSFHLTIVGLCFMVPADGQEKSEPTSNETKSKARLEFMRDAVQKMEIKSTAEDEKRDLKVKDQPLLRYNDPARGITDSAVWRIGSKGRPVALVTSEIYGTQMNHEFLAIDNAELTMRCDRYVWRPPAKTLNFQPIMSDERPAEKPQTRLTQMKRLTERFALTQFHEGNNIELRFMPTPIDRYVPSESPNSDAAIFAAVWGVNPEALLFIETDGSTWNFAFMRSSSAKVWAKLDDVEVWAVPKVFVSPSMDYSITVNPTKVPAEVLLGDEQKYSIGRLILGDLIDRARVIGFHTIIGSVSADQMASIALQETFGFRRVAHLIEVAMKFEKRLDLLYMQLVLDSMSGGS